MLRRTLLNVISSCSAGNNFRLTQILWWCIVDSISEKYMWIMFLDIWSSFIRDCSTWRSFVQKFCSTQICCKWFSTQVDIENEFSSEIDSFVNSWYMKSIINVCIYIKNYEIRLWISACLRSIFTSKAGFWKIACRFVENMVVVL